MEVRMKRHYRGSNIVGRASALRSFLLSFVLSIFPTALFADGLCYLDMGGGGTVGGRQTRALSGSVDQQTALNGESIEGGAALFMDGVVYDDWDTDGAVAMLWEEETALRMLGGYGFGAASGGYGGAEFRGNGTVGMTFVGIVPFNAAVEDTKLRLTSDGVEGKTLLGTTHVLPLDALSNIHYEDSMLYLSVSHGFRYHSELNGWTWSVMPKLRLVDLKHARVKAEYLFGFWHQDRREQSGALYIDIPFKKKLLVSVFGEAEYLKQANRRGEQIGWTAGIDITVHELED